MIQTMSSAVKGQGPTLDRLMQIFAKQLEALPTMAGTMMEYEHGDLGITTRTNKRIRPLFNDIKFFHLVK
jgi:hypothetical protein